jgi:hypothetical protein
MEEIVKADSGETHVRAVLVGGPASLPETSRVQSVSPLSERIKVAHLGGYEHFERRGERPGQAADTGVEYRWTMRTKAAE